MAKWIFAKFLAEKSSARTANFTKMANITRIVNNINCYVRKFLAKQKVVIIVILFNPEHKCPTADQKRKFSKKKKKKDL